MPTTLLTKEEVADLFRTSVRTIDRWRQRYDLGEIKLPGGTVRFDPSKIEEIVRDGKFKRKPRQAR